MDSELDLNADSSRTAADMAYAAIHRMLFESVLRPGDRLSQTKLAEKFGCSTVPVVEAMRRLESEGIIIKEPRRMARVRELSAAEFEELYLIREGLEPIVARRCAERIDDAQIVELKQLSKTFDESALAGDFQECQTLEIAIHRFIAEAAECPLICAELNRLAVVGLTAGRALETHVVPKCYPYAHRALVEAIGDRDADMAEYLMRKHIRQGNVTVQQYLQTMNGSSKSGKARRKRKRSRENQSAK